MNDIVRIVGAFLLWIALFSFVYGLQGIGCAAGWPSTKIAGMSLYRLVLVAAAALAILAQLFALMALQHARLRSASPFVFQVSMALALSALAAQIWSLFPVAVVSACL